MAKVTLKEAVALLNEVHQWDPEKQGRDIFSIKTLYNKISKKELKRYGPRHAAQVDETELLRVLGPKKAS